MATTAQTFWDHWSPVTSLQNPRVKQLVRWRDRRPRDEDQVLLIEGYRGVQRALEAGVRIQELYFSTEWFQGSNESTLLQAASSTGARLVRLGREAFARVAYRERPEGLLAVAPQWDLSPRRLQLPPCPLVLAVESVEKPGNLGTLLRTADAAGVDAVLLGDPVTDVFNPNVVRASTGSLFTMPLGVAGGAEILAYLQEREIPLIAATPHADQTYTDVSFSGPVAIAVGSEQFGLSPPWLEAARNRIRIPMAGRADSLNVAMAAGVLLFEAARQRGFPIRPA